MAVSITKAGERLIAEKQAAQEVLLVARFILALVPGLDPEQPVDRDAPKPPPEQIVHTQTYTQKGFVNPNQVVYSLMMGSDVGDFDWNWIGLETAEEVLLSVGYVPIQQKRKSISPHQIGNNVTRNMMLVVDGAQALTGVTVDASTWQHDFTLRLRDIDERERLSNRDVFGRACFFGDGLQLVSVEGALQLQPGLVFVEGLRIELTNAWTVIPPEMPNKAYLDVALMRQENSQGVAWTLVWGDTFYDYEDATGIAHYLIPVAHLTAPATVKDLRTVEPIGGPLIQHFAARNGDYENLRARATTKEDVGLDQLPNAKSDDPATNSSEVLATTKALSNLDQQIGDSLVGMVASFDMDTAPPGWLERNGANVSRTAYAKLFRVLGIRYGAGDGSTTFNIGDSRGIFIRGLDQGRGLDISRSLGSLQQSQNQSHNHTASSSAAGLHGHNGTAVMSGDHTHTGSIGEAGSHSHIFNFTNTPTSADQPGIGAAMHNAVIGRQAGNKIEPAGRHSHAINIDRASGHTHALAITADGEHFHTVTIDANGGNEARPINQALLICIKY